MILPLDPPRPPRPPLRRWAIGLAALACLAGPGACPTRAETPTDLLRTLRAELRAGDHAAALATARRGAAQGVDDAALFYDLAGLEQMHGDRPAAVAAFARAVALGFDDFRHADRDADLGALREDPVYQDLRRRWANGLQARARARALPLAIDAWSDPVELADRHPADRPPRVVLRLRPTADALEASLSIADLALAPPAPWQGGGGVLVTLVLPEEEAAAEGDVFVEFAFGLLAGDLPAGAVHRDGRWQRLTELDPQIRPQGRDADGIEISLAIPWRLCAPLHPLLDPTLGLNVTCLRPEGPLPPGETSLLADPAAGRPHRTWRRAAPVRWNWDGGTGALVQARPADPVLRDPRLELRPLAVLATADGPGTATIALRDRDGVLQAQRSVTIDGAAGRRAITVDLPADLPAGPARLGITWDDPAPGRTAAFETALVSLPDRWLERTDERLAALPAMERPALRYHRDAVAAALASRRPRDDTAELGLVVAEIEQLLGAFEATGTTLPAGGPYLAARPDPGGGPPLLCSIALPDGWRRGDPVRTLLLLVRATGGQMQAVRQTPRLAAHLADAGPDGPPPAVALAIPHLDEPDGPPADPASIGALMEWLRDLLDCGPVHLAGVDLLAATVLETAASGRDDLAGILMITGLNFVPYPDDGPAALAARVAGLPADLPAGWIWFPDERRPGDQAAALRAALRARGLTLAPARSVPGDLSLVQAWQRALRWAMQP